MVLKEGVGWHYGIVGGDGGYQTARDYGVKLPPPPKKMGLDFNNVELGEIQYPAKKSYFLSLCTLHLGRLLCSRPKAIFF
jgi:hypothetical protein